MIIIKDVVRQRGSNGEIKLACITTDDGPVWECDLNGTNWVKIEMGKAELQESLNKHINETKTN